MVNANPTNAPRSLIASRPYAEHDGENLQTAVGVRPGRLRYRSIHAISRRASHRASPSRLRCTRPTVGRQGGTAGRPAIRSTAPLGPDTVTPRTATWRAGGGQGGCFYR
jgi:hypothetical protein